ncbi:MAG TPA: cell division protein FtsH, partial [Alphaproteobacteria bacterium]|nr:cell division protein FtsH [Alphaproteobacteria bacterium]
LHIVAKALLEYETLTGEEIKALMRGESLHRDDQDRPAPQGPVTAVPVSGRPRKSGATEGAGPMEPQPQGS